MHTRRNFRDLRDWIAYLEEEGELVHVTAPFKLEPEAGALGRAICDMQGPAVLIEKVLGFTDQLLLGGHASFRRTALAMGLPKDALLEEQLSLWIKGWKDYPVPYEIVANGPVLENCLERDKVNILRFPIPRINRHDGSFYLSKAICITRDPETGGVNAGMHRLMVLDVNSTAILMLPEQHISRHYIKYLRTGKPMPMAVALGTEPVLPMVAGMKIPADWEEFAFAGAIREAPLQLVRGPYTGLPIPAGAEIVLEGEVGIGESVLEGPFGEFTGAYSGYFYTPRFEVKLISHRDDPIYECLYVGRPNAENHYMTLLSKLASADRELKALIPSITKVAFLGPYVYNTVIQGRWRHSGEPRQAINSWWGSRWAPGTKLVICVDEDVDPWNAFEVLWAVATRVQGDKDIIIQPYCEVHLDPAADERGMSTKVGINATKPIYPHFRYRPVEWVTSPERTETWKKVLADLWSHGEGK